MREFESLKVMYHDRLVGRLTMGTNAACLFQYDREWLNTGFSISPLKLPLKGDLFEADYLPFQGNFGVFEDCMPGGYGEYVLQKELEKQGINYKSLNPLQKLSIVGSSGMGALCYIPDNKITMSNEPVNLDEIQQSALDVLSGKTYENAGRLYVNSGNSGGVHPKILLQDDGRNWIIKFRHTYDPIESGVIEFMYNQAAKEAGIIVPSFKLFDGRYFGEERFDLLPDGERIHMITASGLLNESINPPKMDYKTLLALTGYITQDHIEVEQQFRRMVFNYYAENFDDHARNFSFLYMNGKWKLSPAYDMTHDSPLGQHATTVGFKANPIEEDFIEAGTSVQISRKLCAEIIDEVKPVGQRLVDKLRKGLYDISVNNDKREKKDQTTT
ncbi:type II toxin-antitoxin system HipA family toxin [Prevotella sp. OH937_COT-195]|uniref:type II toxin-antitoxin system HipA family toxin n=1 Tax=Prevotella sp. OH937_COT-195 TaxID=2491051 RepID=UPI000F647268|nr:type II toxin-antitoxin system HipA family toxin [Prevotella sp. OH937_COT-195]RRD02370.1 type II toxin-antitoxin system HipA family toxin [Prevotella sp. OH937_COT-195]